MIDETTELESYLVDEDADSREANGEVALPKVLPILPLRNVVVYPGIVTSLAIGRDRSRQLIAECKPNRTVIGLVAQKDASVDEPGYEVVYSVGTAATILKIIKMPQGPVHVVVHALSRFKVLQFLCNQPYLKARVTPLHVTFRKTKKLEALMVSVRRTANRVIELSPNVHEEAAVILENIEHPSALADYLAANLNLSIADKQDLLEEADAGKRLDRISVALAKQQELLEMSHKIQGKVRDSIDKSQREYYLQEQLKAIQTELGHADSQAEELKQIAEAIQKAAMPKDVEAEARRELDRLAKIPSASPEYSVLRTYLDWMCEMPWSVQTEDQLDIRRAERILNQDHYDLHKVKRRILEFLAVRKLNPTGKSPILCFSGPPGVGKTSLGRSIARAMGRRFVRMSLGGMHDEADIRGHRRTYIGALPGRILQEIRKCRSRNPVFMLDELDKIGVDFRGDPASALLEVLDPEQNATFTDHYLDQPFDLSRVLFIATANVTEPIPPALFDRMEIIELPGYTATEKLRIARRYLVPRQLKEHGLHRRQLAIQDPAVRAIIQDYTREAGVRNLERHIAAICRHVATAIAKNARHKASIDSKDLARILGPTRFESELALRAGIPGVATGLAYTPVGGDLLFIESASMPGKGHLRLTGQIGEVMKESAEAAFSIVKAHAKRLGLEPDQFGKSDFHIHVPAGAIPKDGPSAGVAMLTSLVSLLQGRPVRHDVAMTGEITLRGLVLPIGGLKEKILAAKRAGIKTVILPARNRKDMGDVPKEAKKGMTFRFVRNAEEVLRTALAEA